ncbi:sensor histidine kinase [Eubacteriales bacterium KG125]
MKRKRSMQKQLTLLVGCILLVCNLVLIALLNYSLSLVLKDLVIPIGDMQIEIYNIDNFSSKLKMYGYIFAFLTTTLGTLITYIFLGRYLLPLKKLSKKMDDMDRQNLRDSVEFSSRAVEISSLIDSFNNLMNKLKNSFEMQKNFSSYVAHQLKTPLAVLQTKIEVFNKKGYEERESKELLKIVSVQVNKLNNIISKILDFSHIERMELKEDIPLDVLLEDLLVDFEERTEKEDIKLKFENSVSSKNKENKKFNIIGNYTLLYQAFFNLVDNAIKYSYKGDSVKVALESGKEQICIKIFDTGMGIKEIDKEHIFEPFFRCEDLEKNKKEGIGMGLSFSKKVFDQHRAKIQIRDNVSKGTVVEIYFKRGGRL